ncbi:hypothetical protein SIM97_18945 [Pectobacterium zantedeschiae]|uniref:hypothetical protein n=1 Tax=Pectobacterium zantedeschiae TaxID=2034769 RepID=UPI0037540B12
MAGFSGGVFGLFDTTLTRTPRRALLPPDTLPPCCDFPVCLCHIIAAASAAAISRCVNEPGFIAARAVPQLACGMVKRLPGAGWRSPQDKMLNGEAPGGGRTGRRWRARERARSLRLRAGRSQCSRVGAGRGEALQRRDEGTASALGLMLTLVED